MPTATSIDLHSQHFIANPYPAYRALRESSYPQWLPHQDRTGTEGIWLFARYRDVAAILRDTDSVSKDVGRLIPADRMTAFDRMLLNMDPPEHSRLRAVIAPLFSVRRVAQLEAIIESIVDELLSGIESGKEIDFISCFALPLPIRVVAGVIGVPAEDMPALKAWTDDMITGLDSTCASDAERAKVAVSLGAMTEYLRDLIERGDSPRGSLLEHVAAVQREQGTPTPDEVLSLCVLMVLAGHETTVNLFGNGLLTLLRHPGQLERLRRNRELVHGAVEEMLRFESPLQRATFRITTSAFEMGGVTVEPGQQLSAMLGAANRDPSVFDSPDEFDIDRKPNRHLAFGKGVHKCLGERLARAEARIAFTRLLARFPRIELLDQHPCWQDKTLFRGLKSLHLSL